MTESRVREERRVPPERTSAQATRGEDRRPEGRTAGWRGGPPAGALTSRTVAGEAPQLSVTSHKARPCPVPFLLGFSILPADRPMFSLSSPPDARQPLRCLCAEQTQRPDCAFESQFCPFLSQHRHQPSRSPRLQRPAFSCSVLNSHLSSL